MSHRRLLAVLLPAAVFVIVVAGIRTFRKEVPPQIVRPAAQPTPGVKSNYYVAPAERRPSAPATVLARSLDEASFRSTYDNYRTAVVTGNARIQASLHPLVLKRKDLAISYAQKELGRARTESDRQHALKTLETLER